MALPSSAPSASQSASGSVYLVPSFANSAGGSWRTRSTSARMASCVSVGVPGGNSIGGAFDVSASAVVVSASAVAAATVSAAAISFSAFAFSAASAFSAAALVFSLRSPPTRSGSSPKSTHARVHSLSLSLPSPSSSNTAMSFLMRSSLHWLPNSSVSSATETGSLSSWSASSSAAAALDSSALAPAPI